MISFVFPGQGSQKIGMSLDVVQNFTIAKEILEEIEDAVSLNITRIIKDSSIEELTKTDNAQIAIFTASMVIWNTLKQYIASSSVKYLAGHSLGEYSALAASGFVSLGEAAQIVLQRGRIMAETSDSTRYKMCAILGLSAQQVETILCDEVVIANDNSNMQVVLSGIAKAVEKVAVRALNIGAKKVINLNTSGPFHSYFMKESIEKLAKILENYEFFLPEFSVIMNVTASPLEDIGLLKNMMLEHVTNRVRWRESVDFMVKNGVNRIIEIGPSKVLTNLSKRAYPDVIMDGVENISELESFVKSI
ncbi:MAG: ACP S-malonyltransferase [Holosporales bacterium]|jgi:[acyl-carrier-protein] S-malonyltransferase|nr:ACP S-malonyltransferase [Holosporales bacterium]